ncbi:MAG: LolA family protein [Shimia sp.]
MKTLALALALTLAPLAALAQKIPLNEIDRYLNQELQNATGAFTQINSDGSISTGTVYIKRPGRMRFEYNPPERAMVIAAGGSLAIFDPNADGAEQYPLSQTPLSIILDRNVNLGRERMLMGHWQDGNTTIVRAQDPENPEYGNLELVFTANPTQLRQWVVNDDTGGSTTVILGDLDRGSRIPNRLFNIIVERDRWAADG